MRRLRAIHVSGTKGKGSTCAFCESILRHAGLRTGLYTSPHLVEVRERIAIDGAPLSRAAFAAHFWSCWDALQASAHEPVMQPPALAEAVRSGQYSVRPMPAYFRFLTILALRVFLEERVDVAVIETGIGGLYDATNVLDAPAVCGIASLGFDHMAILGYSLPEIAAHKAGIMKRSVPTYIVMQRTIAMRTIAERAIKQDVPLWIVFPLEENAGMLRLGLAGDHQRLNAALAVSLANEWLHRAAHPAAVQPVPSETLPSTTEPVLTAAIVGYPEASSEANTLALSQTVITRNRLFPITAMMRRALESTRWPGRTQVIPSSSQRPFELYLDGAHTAESMLACAHWFHAAVPRDPASRHVLWFGCSPDRDALHLLGPLADMHCNSGLAFDAAVFSPNTGCNTEDNANLMLQQQPSDTLDTVQQWAYLWTELTGSATDAVSEAGAGNGRGAKPDVLVFSSLDMALDWLHEYAAQQRPATVRTLVTGSLHLVGGVLSLLIRRGVLSSEVLFGK